jgi:hypothetical protein
MLGIQFREFYNRSLVGWALNGIQERTTRSQELLGCNKYISGDSFEDLFQFKLFIEDCFSFKLFKNGYFKKILLMTAISCIRNSLHPEFSPMEKLYPAPTTRRSMYAPSSKWAPLLSDVLRLPAEPEITVPCGSPQ